MGSTFLPVCPNCDQADIYDNPRCGHKFKKGIAYGFYDCGKVFRYSPGSGLYAPEDFYRIEENRNIVIYSSAFVGGSEYYYSSSLATPIRRLNLRNIKQGFAAYPKFISAVKKLNKRTLHGDQAKRDNNGNFIINNIYKEAVPK